ncbi:MAG TPA: hypothetical protein VG868_13930, partial [Casimicrobiaceae bacterium]|nr:hypothetical protein [Casimicrobiaceae bacterium]
DWIIDLGPEAGDRGGELVTSGRPEDVAKVERSHTGRWLRTVLPNSAAAPSVATESRASSLAAS